MNSGESHDDMRPFDKFKILPMEIYRFTAPIIIKSSELKLLGQIKKIRYGEFSCNNLAPGKIKKSQFKWYEEYEFNLNGNSTKTQFTPLGISICQTISSFDINGNIVQIKLQNEHEVETWSIYLKYDKSQNLIEEKIIKKHYVLYSKKLLHNEDMKCIEIVFYFKSGGISSKCRQEFSNKGLITKEEKFSSKDVLTEKTIFKYHENGDLEQEIIYNSKSEISFRRDIQYNEDGKILTKIWFEKWNFKLLKYISYFDKEGKILKELKFDSNRLIRTINYVYSDGKLLQENEYNYKGELTERVLRSYDERGNLIEQLLIPQGKIYRGFRCDFDKENMLIEKTEIDYGVELKKSFYKYDDSKMVELLEDNYQTKKKKLIRIKYDDSNNWVSKIEYNLTENYTTIYLREIEYYK